MAHGQSGKSVTLSGYIRDGASQEALPGATVYDPASRQGAASNVYGFYSLTLPEGAYNLVYSYVGYQQKRVEMTLTQGTKLDVSLAAADTLSGVEVIGEREENRKISQQVQMSVIDIPVSQIRDIPALLGEKDVLKVIQLLPGVQKGAEGQTGFYVRGGGPDQNLILLDGAPVYNANHLFGFFSVFNGYALKSVQLTKGGFPARYGGRLSSVLDMTMKEGNRQKLSGEAGIGLISSRVTLEGPIEKGKSSFLVSGRRTYVDLLMRPFMNKEKGIGGYFFHDFNAKVNRDFGPRDKLYLSGYFGQDKFFFREQYQYDSGTGKTSSNLQWGNRTATLRWNHEFSQKVFGNLSLIHSYYRFGVFSRDEDHRSSFRMDYTSIIRDWGAKYDLELYPAPRHTIRVGAAGTWHAIRPSSFLVVDKYRNYTDRQAVNRAVTDGIESGVYGEHQFQASDRLQTLAGLRLSSYLVQGRHYFNPEPRVSTSLIVAKNTSVKASYAMMNQFIHLLSSSSIGLPTDIWISTNKRIKPQRSQQVALGLAHDLEEHNLAISLEGYYKQMSNIIAYKEGASFALVDDPFDFDTDDKDWEDAVTQGKGWSQGLELLFQRKAGRLTGWLGYTLSWTTQQFDELNFGRKFYARYDRRHDIGLVLIYKLSPDITLSGVWVYGTGSRYTMPFSRYSASADRGPAYSDYRSMFYPTNTGVGEIRERNNFIGEAYHRADIGMQFHKKKSWGERTFELSFYNAYSRRNPFFYELQDKYTYDPNTGQSTRETKLFRISLFPIIPSISWSFKF